MNNYYVKIFIYLAKIDDYFFKTKNNAKTIYIKKSCYITIKSFFLKLHYKTGGF